MISTSVMMDYTDIEAPEMEEVEDWSKPLAVNNRGCSRSPDSSSANTTDHHKTIIHFDMDCFYAQVEMINNPELRSKPLGIQQKNIVVTCNYVARERGVTKLMYLTDAKKRCPDLVLVSGEDLTKYRQMSFHVSEFFQKYTPFVERLGFDENFVDVTDMVDVRIRNVENRNHFVGHLYDEEGAASVNKCCCGCEQRLQTGSQIAADIREALEIELGLTCCAGIAHNKLLAKLVASTHKPNQQTSILPHSSQQLLVTLPSVRSIPGIGSSMSKRLKSLNISSVEDLQNADRKMLDKEFGFATASLITQLSRGVDATPVITFGQPQTLSDEDSFKCCQDLLDAQRRMKSLLFSLCQRLQDDGRIPQTLRLTIRRVGKNYHKESRQCPLQADAFIKLHQTGSVDKATESLMTNLNSLFAKLVDVSKPFHLTLINVCFAKLVKKASEISSFFTTGTNIADKISSPIKHPAKHRIPPIDATLHLASPNHSSSDLGKAAKCDYTDCDSQAFKGFHQEDSEAKSYHERDEKTAMTNGEEDVHQENNCSTISRKTRSESWWFAVKKLLPPDVDLETLCELPDHVQRAVLADYGIRAADLKSVNKTSSTTKIDDTLQTKTPKKRPLFSPVKASKAEKKKCQRTKSDHEFNHGNLSSNETLSSPKMVDNDSLQTTSPCMSHDISGKCNNDRKSTCLTPKANALSFKEQMRNLKPCESSGSPKMALHVQTNDPIRNLQSGSKSSHLQSSLKPQRQINLQPSDPNPLISNVKPSTQSSQPTASKHTCNQTLSIDTLEMETSINHQQIPNVSFVSESLKSKLPSGIDPTVFSELPNKIQGEIMAHVVMGVSSSSSATKSQSIAQLAGSKPGAHKQKNQNTLLSYFKKS